MTSFSTRHSPFQRHSSGKCNNHMSKTYHLKSTTSPTVTSLPSWSEEYCSLLCLCVCLSALCRSLCCVSVPVSLLFFALAHRFICTNRVTCRLLKTPSCIPTCEAKGMGLQRLSAAPPNDIRFTVIQAIVQVPREKSIATACGTPLVNLCC